MGFFAGNIVRKDRYLEGLELEKRLKKLGQFSDGEIEHIQGATDIPKDQVLDILELIYDPEMSYDEKIEILEEDRSATKILFILSTMKRQS